MSPHSLGVNPNTANATMEVGFQMWWAMHFTNNPNFNTLSAKSQKDFRKVAEQAWRAGGLCKDYLNEIKK